MSVLYLTTATFSQPAVVTGDPLTSKRSVINLSYVSEFTYHIINHFKMGDYANSYRGISFFVAGKTWNQMIDSEGWPNDPDIVGTEFGGGLRVPSTTDFTGKYVMTWLGNGDVRFNAGTFTVDVAASSNYTETSPGRYTNTPGLVPRIVFTLTGLSGHPHNIQVIFKSTGVAGSHLRDFKWYRLDDEARLNAGKVFRVPFLDTMATLNPVAIRFLNWHGGNIARNCRWENRTLPAAAGYSSVSNWVASPPYGTATFTDGVNANQYTLTAVTTGPKQTPVAHQHGEIVTARVGPAAVRQGTYTGGGVFKTITSIVTGATTTFNVTAHGFNVGDTIICLMPTGTTLLDKRPLVIATTPTANQFTVAVSSSGTFSGGTVGQYVSLNVGSRGAYPIIFENGSVYVSTYGDTYIKAGYYYTFYFDKTLSVFKDSSGNPVFGVWMFNGGEGGGHKGDVPLEICTALINEVNERALALGYNNPIHMWISMPHWSLLTMDPDYNAASNYAVKGVDVILNGAGSYAGLTSRASVILEYSNEIWNTAGDAFAQSFYLAQRGVHRWGLGLTSTSDWSSMSALRSTVMVRDIKAAFPGNSRLRFTLGAWGSIRYENNQLHAEGTTAYLTDTLVTSGSFGTPISNHDAINHGAYFDAGDSTHYYGPGKGTGTFWDDACMYNGENNTTNGGGNYSGAANPTQAITNFVNNVASGGGQSMDYYCNPTNPSAGSDSSFAVAMAGFGKKSIHYEGSFDWWCVEGAHDWASITLTANQAAFKRAASNSTQYATAFVTRYMGAINALANSYIPAAYYITMDYNGEGGGSPPLYYPDQRWAHATPDTYAGGVEGQALLNNPTWVAMGVRNRGLPT